jgi:enediyne polyketide synthase
MEHFRATCRFDHPTVEVPQLDAVHAVTLAQAKPMVGMQPARELYGKLFFHAGRFRRIQGYHRLHATECVAALSPAVPMAWFGGYLPDTLVLGDAAARDAALHAIQACIPQATLLPVGVEQILPGAATATPQWVQAQERQRQGAVFVYDVSVLDGNLQVCEHWQGLRLHMVAGTAWHGPWVAPLLGPYVERRLPELVPGLAVSVAVHCDTHGARQEQSTLAIQQALGTPLAVWRRPDGKPLVHDRHTVSAAHIPGVTLAVAGSGLLSCDLQQKISQSPALWRDLLGSERCQLVELLVRQPPGEDFDTAATRLWATGECLTKAGLLSDTPVKFHSLHPDGWVVLTMGTMCVVTLATTIQNVDAPVVLAIAAGYDHARL